MAILNPNPTLLFSLQNPDIVLVHYLNVPAIEDCGKPCGPILCSINTDKKEWAKWTKEELIGQLKPMCESMGSWRGGGSRERQVCSCPLRMHKAQGGVGLPRFPGAGWSHQAPRPISAGEGGERLSWVSQFVLGGAPNDAAAGQH